MGLVLGEWFFADAHSLNIHVVADMLRDRMQLEVLVIEEQPKPSLDIPFLKERLIRWEFDADRISVCAFIQENHYVLAHIDCIMCAHGGHLPDPDDPETISWQPHPRAETLLRAWNELSWRQQFVLKHPAVLFYAERFFERWLYPVA
jgi:hypothetical protein